MHYLGERNICKDMFKILEVLQNNLNNCIIVNVKHLFGELKITLRDVEYWDNLITILENEDYIESAEIDNQLILKIKVKGILLLDEYNWKKGASINEN